MVDAPERIWLPPGANVFDCTRQNAVATVEYVRADLVAHTVEENILLERQVAELRAERNRAIDERDEARQEPWPKWADEIRKCLEGYGVDPGDEWDLPEQFEIWIAGVVENETARLGAVEAENARLSETLAEIMSLESKGASAHGKWGDAYRIARTALSGSGVRPALPLKEEVEREAVWLIERKGWGDNEPHWYAENGTGWHRWTKVAADAKRFASKSEAEAYSAYQQIADDPSITLTEHIFLSRLRAGEQEGWRSMDSAPKDGTNILYVTKFKDIGFCHWDEGYNEDDYPCWWDNERDDEVCPIAWLPADTLPAAPSEQGGGRG